MKNAFGHIVSMIFIALLCLPAMMRAQEKGIRFNMSDGKIVLRIDRNDLSFRLDSMLSTMGTNERALDLIWTQKRGDTLIRGWSLAAFNEEEIVFNKRVTDIEGGLNWLEDMVVFEAPLKGAALSTFYPKANYGINKFDEVTVWESTGGLTWFRLKGHGNANSVYLSGSFNQWSTLSHPMRKTEDGWIASLKLEPGKHLYKFIVDGRWMADPENEQRERDGYEGYNSVYFEENHTFFLPGYNNARRVYVAGSFNGWKRRELRMKRYSDGWRLPVYLTEGTHTYKFIVDGDWILDPLNSNARPDGMGNINSVVSKGDPVVFELKGFEAAKEVYLSGNFNGWNERELKMQWINGSWRLPYVLGPGNYQYKYIIDGVWTLDPGNPLTATEGGYVNSLRVVEPNHTFCLQNHKQATRVILSGTFNGWAQQGYQMQFDGEGWTFPYHLPPGKHLYKYLVDGEWIIDPGNPLREPNEFSGYNSVLWVKP